MIRRTWCFQGVLLAVVLAIYSGCGPSSPPVASNPPTVQEAPSDVAVKMPGPPVQKLPGPPAPVEAPAVSPLAATPQPTETGEPSALPATPPEAPATPTEVVKAEAGVAKQGRSLDEHEGILVTPAKAYFAVREKAVFQIAIPSAVNLYKGEHGEVPLTLAEFQEKILVPNKIKLPTLPPGHTYEWDPEAEQLNVRRPVK